MTTTEPTTTDDAMVRTELRVLDAAHHGRQLERHLAALVLYGVPATESGEAHLGALAAGIAREALELVDDLRAELVAALEGLDDLRT